MLIKELYFIHQNPQIIKGLVKSLHEDVNQYLSLTLAKLKNKPSEELTDTKNQSYVDLDYLAKLIIALTVLYKADQREAFSKNELGFNPNSAEDLHKFLKDIEKLKNDPEYVTKAIDFIAKVTPSAVKKQREELEKLLNGSDAEKSDQLKKIEKFVIDVARGYHELETKSKR